TAARWSRASWRIWWCCRATSSTRGNATTSRLLRWCSRWSAVESCTRRSEPRGNQAMTRKTSSAPVGGVALKLQGKAVALAGNVNEWHRQALAHFIKAEGGKLVEQMTISLDYLVIVNWWRKGQPAEAKEAEKLNQKQGAAIQIVAEQDFYLLF